MHYISSLALAVAICGPAAAHDFRLGDLAIAHPVAYETAATARSGGGYFTVTNSGSADDQLVGIEADFPKVMLHRSEETDGIARMHMVDKIEIPAGATVALEPGGMHVMFMGLGGDPFEAGEEIPATLIFEEAGKIEILFKVEPLPTRKEDHAGHDGS